ncbi:MAG: sigma-70 family RNA polymerase sigma factor [Clostridia bacterium]|nr:sigma-70 family RNA polymerase sigma factor [Clostridia bacterium]
MIDYSDLSILVERVKHSDQKAFEQLYMKTYRIVYGIACSILRDKNYAEDITQEVYIKVYLHIDQLKDSNNFISWLHMITINTCQDHLRHENRCNDIILDDNGSDFVDDWIKGKYLVELFDGIISVLPEEQRRVIYLFYYRQMTVWQIAALEDCPVGTVKSRLAYARRTLKKALLDEERRSGEKLMLSPVTAALSVMMSLPVADFTLSLDTAVKILASVLSAVSAAGSAADGGIHIISDITEEKQPFIFKRWIVKISLISVIFAALSVSIPTILIISAMVSKNAVNASLNSEKSLPDTQPIIVSPPDDLQPDSESIDIFLPKETENPDSEVVHTSLLDNSRAAYTVDEGRYIYTPCVCETDINISAPRRIMEWTPDGVASEGEYFDVPVSKDWISSVAYDSDSPYDTSALDFTLKMSWDDDWLYVYTEFIDTDGYNCISRKDIERELWYESMLQLSIAASENDNDYQNMIVALNSYGDKRTRIASYSRYIPQDDDFSVTVSQGKNGDRVIYEVRVPFESFSDDNAVYGNIYRFAMVISWGNNGMLRHTQLAEGISGDHIGVPSMFAYLTLTDEPNASNTRLNSKRFYDTNDIAFLNTMIEEHNLPLTKAPADGSSVPDDWKEHMIFGGEDNRLLMLKLSDMNVGGTVDLSGFDSLRLAELERSSIKSIDAHGLKRLKTLLCDGNELTELNITGDIFLSTLSCRHNKLSTLRFTGAENIKLLYCDGNLLSELDINRLRYLTRLCCSVNLLERIDLTYNYNLSELLCEYNMITELDLSSCKELYNLHCEHNLLETEQYHNQHDFYELERSDKYITYQCSCGYRYSEYLPEK